MKFLWPVSEIQDDGKSESGDHGDQHYVNNVQRRYGTRGMALTRVSFLIYPHTEGQLIVLNGISLQRN